MKTSNRIRKNNATKPAPAQVSIPEPGIDGTGYCGKEPICLTVFDHDSDQDLAGCDITPEEWQSLKQQAAKSGLAVGDLLKLKIQGADNADQLCDALREFENVKGEAVAALILLMNSYSDVVSFAMRHGWEDDLSHGLSIWSNSVQDKLEDMFSKCWEASRADRNGGAK